MNPKQKKMLMAIGVLVLAAIILALLQKPAVTGYIIRNDSVYYYLDNPDKVMEEYNKNIEYVPGFIKTIFGNERINLEVSLENGSKREYGILTEKGTIISVEKQYLEDPTLNAKISEATINKLLQAEDQVGALKEALDNKEIGYEAVKVKTKVKTFFARIALKVFGWFS